MENNTFEYVVPCHFGMEAVLKREIMALGYEIVNVADGRVTFRGDEKAIARANIFLRTAERILLKIGSFKAYTFDDLFEGTKKLPGGATDEEVDNVSLSGITTKDVKETLKVDCVNTRIKSMQKMLNILGYSVDREDGYFSVNTQAALQQFETDNHLNVDGEYSQSDKQMLVARMMIYINNHEFKLFKNL